MKAFCRGENSFRALMKAFRAHTSWLLFSDSFLRISIWELGAGGNIRLPNITTSGCLVQLDMLAIFLDAFAMFFETVARSFYGLAMSLETVARSLYALAMSLEMLASSFYGLAMFLETLARSLETLARSFYALAMSFYALDDTFFERV